MLEILLMERAKLLREIKKYESSLFNNYSSRKRVLKLSTKVKEVEGQITEMLDNEPK